MSDTIPDVEVSKEVYVSLNTLTGITVGTALVLENKSTLLVRLQLAATQPAANSTAGVLLYPRGTVNSIKTVSAGENSVWSKSLENLPAIISVQRNS